MGIRYERDNRKATNGPLFFFSLYRDEAFEEEIRGAFYSGLSFYAYRFPHDNMLCYGSSEGFIEGIGEPGFVIGMFSPAFPYFTIPYKGVKTAQNRGSLYNMPSESTPREVFEHEVDQIIKNLKPLEEAKVVAARVLVRNNGFDIAEKFYDLCQRFPEAFIFCFSTPATGCWIGASPELLLSGNENYISTMSLAGTRLAGSSRDWDVKNIEEQRIVTKYIEQVFKNNGLNPLTEEPSTVKTGEIEHICTRISAENSNLSVPGLSGLLKDLSPTPALCGYPKDFALNLIYKLENFERGCYGGFCGPFRSVSDFTFHVSLRCAAVSEKVACLYAGGGITARSGPSSEWLETTLKLRNTFS